MLQARRRLLVSLKLVNNLSIVKQEKKHLIYKRNRIYKMKEEKNVFFVILLYRRKDCVRMNEHISVCSLGSKNKKKSRELKHYFITHKDFVIQSSYKPL